MSFLIISSIIMTVMWYAGVGLMVSTGEVKVHSKRELLEWMIPYWMALKSVIDQCKDTIKWYKELKW